ncbi:hypothetical protein DICPUDRAFT_153321 [Dictyostelium purpureum]|uniref:Uncharacterized protein n=1 Tax=Dictyostelium purpureum TaxID=5786 RepID=F0ZNL6_DICPU|nr:uncharacterized protein DICPUDRAFT_153321 [Dictyostelium purpureum]EGC34466.1 hypothetical protein DICPUDRAFT_153321 [Dictyostelium purpureum]|eukprot:XP_003289001.1 hypothetical protein DICPUDRAFT_153321 [Dictyostelium purpureum]
MSYFSDHVSIDPDFSVLLDSSSASKDSQNSICSKKSNGLSAAKIAGIIIGSIAFVAIVIICIVYHIQKTKKQKLFISNMKLKMGDLNK